MIFDLIKSACTKTYNGLIDWFAAPVPLAGMNFNISALCPASLSQSDQQVWTAAYLRQLKDDSLLLWANPENQLMLSYSRENQYTHVCLTGATINPTTRRIFIAGKEVHTLNVIRATLLRQQQNVFPLAIYVPDSDRLSRLKPFAYLSQGHVIDELITQIRTLTQRLEDNFESATSCRICLEDYSQAKPPMQLTATKSLFHASCIQTHFNTRRERGQNLTDPLSNLVIASDSIVPADVDVLLKFQAETKPVFELLRTSSDALTVLLRQRPEEPSNLNSNVRTPTSRF